MRLNASTKGMDERIHCGIETLHFKGKAGVKTLSGAFMFAFIQVKSKVNKKSRSRILTR